MAKNNKTVAKVPNLRFKEFQDEWQPQKLGRICTKIGSGKTPKGGEDVYITTGIPFIRSQNVINNSLILDDTHISHEMHKSMKSSTVLANDILLNITGGSIGRSCVVPNDFIEGNVNQHVSIIRLKEFNSNFLQAILSSSVGQKLIYQGQTGSGREGLNFQSIKNFNIYFPSIKEQNKVSQFLELINKRINTQNKIIEDYQLLKKGTMQKLFKQELRFKNNEGNTFSDWDLKKLGNVTNINMGQSPESSSYNSDGDGSYLIQGNADIFNRKTSPRNWTSKPTKLCDIGDLILTVRAPVGTVAKSNHKACIGRGVCSIKSKTISNIEFIYQFLLDYENRWTRLEQGSTFTAVSGRDIKSIEINLPSIKEQQKIAATLSVIDAKIALETKLLEQYKSQKKYLLQNLFI